jgi:PBP1b-binding outer membrane lipoprotein LpoB
MYSISRVLAVVVLLSGCVSAVQAPEKAAAADEVEVIATSQEDADTCSAGQCSHITDSALELVANEHAELLRLREFVRKLVEAMKSRKDM